MKWIFFLSTAIGLVQSEGTFTATSYMNTPRIGSTATLLPSAKVLIAGGATATAELFDPASESFTLTGDMVTPRRFHTATLLPDERVLVVGGFVGDSQNNVPTATAEIYNPTSEFSRRWTT